MAGDTPEIEQMIATMRTAIAARPDAPYNLIGLAETVAAQGDRRRAAELTREAMAQGRADPATQMRGRRLLAALLPGYHVPMMNDPRRNAAWDKALRAAIAPGMLVLEIGTGAGMLALMAARAGAQVVTVEINPITAQLARDLAARNGLADRITVITGQSHKLKLGKHVPRPADLLICDIFGDELLDFDPLTAIADARRLLAPGARTVPMAASLRAALADWSDHARSGLAEASCGFDLTPFADFVPAALPRPVDMPGLTLLSEPHDLFRFDFAGALPTVQRRTLPCPITAGGEANTIARWPRLELDPETILEANPQPAPYFSGLTLTPLAQPIAVTPGDTLTIGTAHNRRSVSTWVEATA